MVQQMDGNVSYYFHPKTNWRFSDDFPIPTAVIIEFERVSNPSILHGCVSPRPSCRFQVESPPNSCLKTARTDSQNWLPLVGNEEWIPIMTMYGFIPSFPTKGIHRKSMKKSTWFNWIQQIHSKPPWQHQEKNIYVCLNVAQLKTQSHWESLLMASWPTNIAMHPRQRKTNKKSSGTSANATIWTWRIQVDMQPKRICQLFQWPEAQTFSPRFPA